MWCRLRPSPPDAIGGRILDETRRAPRKYGCPVFLPTVVFPAANFRPYKVGRVVAAHHRPRFSITIHSRKRAANYPNIVQKVDHVLCASAPLIIAGRANEKHQRMDAEILPN